MIWWTNKRTDPSGALRTDPGRLLIQSLLYPERLASLCPGEWDALLRLAKRLRLLGRVAAEVERLDLRAAIPATAREVLDADQTALQHRHTLITWELDRILWALQDAAYQPVLLKGCAYLLAGLPPAPGRSFADVDLMLPKAQLLEVEAILQANGWVSQKRHAYDQRYYREWMHELPPMRHREREVEVDLHHTLLPLTSRLNPPAELLFQQAVPIPGTGYRMLSPADMVLHSATHLFYDGEIKGGLRDLFDLHDLLGHFGAQPGFWDSLVPRAERLDLERPLYYALRYCHRLLATPIPHRVLQTSRRRRPHTLNRLAMDALVTRVLTRHELARDATPLAVWPLYLRSHWLRMRPWLLTQHLARKLWRLLRGEN